MNETTTIDLGSDRFTVMTKSKVFFMSNPQTAVIPVLLNGQRTSDKGFLVCYSTTDEEILKTLHEAICKNFKCRPYAAMLYSMRNSASIFSCSELDQYITGYKY